MFDTVHLMFDNSLQVSCPSNFLDCGTGWRCTQSQRAGVAPAATGPHGLLPAAASCTHNAANAAQRRAVLGVMDLGCEANTAAADVLPRPTPKLKLQLHKWQLPLAE